MKIKVKVLGYYGGRLREQGETFDLLDDKHFSDSWMERVGDTAEKTLAPDEPSHADLVADGVVKAAATESARRGPGRPRANS